MNTKVDMSFSVDIEDVYSELSYKDQQEFIKSHIDDIGGFEDIMEQCFEERDTVELVNSYIDNSHGYMNYVPKFQEVFPELNHISSEELADRFRELGIEFYTTERKPVSPFVRLTMPFAFIVGVILILSIPIHYFITGRWKYSLKSNTKLMNWFEAVGF